ncbi:ABC transporter ATP-binding protein [Comamonas endophytica]|uniref:ABC transporter ATP-binding protein n=1 Tax=Comamonas endophytica TaxID=2949090 RepID=A0ABY6GDQ4_9BURK|nr:MULTISPECIES: ABC transporter ATP-binding protein [unclassified Acidovorax]MCD2513051.1 ABC transporter ATP-binding protein [Acidovorax sp. D4N7]UYG52609.1 ABC transporter ATP-binding protein [Acidovorax sp. 5MLIR]
MALLEVSQLQLTLATPRGPAVAVRGMDFSLERGATLGIIGESGSGKSLTAMALMGLLPEHAQLSGSIRFDGRELIGLRESERSALRGNRMAMVFQEPMTALNPLHRIGRQVAEPLRRHRGLDAAAARRQAVALLDRVGIADAARRADAYPHEFSGGQRQRITIAMALACEPDLLIADEPTTALDVTIQQQILDLISDLVDERGMALLLISHDLAVVSQNVDQMLVMYGGTVVESGPTEAIFGHLGHPYTRALLAARPQLGAAQQRLPTIAGSVPALGEMPPGCPFAGRCAHTIDPCTRQRPPAVRVDGAADHWTRCVRPEVVQTPSAVSAPP